MSEWVAFLRAINVAGHATVGMDRLREAFERAGCRRVRTVIQSGNVIFEAQDASATALFKRIQLKARDLLGTEAVIVIRRADDIRRLVRSNPFRDRPEQADEKRYVCFLSDGPITHPGLPLVSEKEALEVIGAAPLEAFVVSRRKQGKPLYGFPNSFVEQQFGVQATTRNWSTVRRISDLLSGESGQG